MSIKTKRAAESIATENPFEEHSKDWVDQKRGKVKQGLNLLLEFFDISHLAL